MTDYLANLSKVLRCQQILGYEFKESLNCLRALQASGQPLSWEGQYVRVAKNDRLAVFGDVVVKLLLCERWFATGRPKGDWTTIEQSTLTNEKLSTLGFASGLDTCVVLNDGTHEVSFRTMATTVEALLGAVYLDAGIDTLARVAINLGITHHFLEAVTLLSPPMFSEKDATLISLLTEFLDRDVVALKILRKGASGPVHDLALSACDVHWQPLHHRGDMSGLRSWEVRPVHAGRAFSWLVPEAPL